LVYGSFLAASNLLRRAGNLKTEYRELRSQKIDRNLAKNKRNYEN
jgi:hypothetical protein